MAKSIASDFIFHTYMYGEFQISKTGMTNLMIKKSATVNMVYIPHGKN